LQPINTSLYLCDNKFHTEALAELLESDAKFGFIVMDGNGALYGTLAGNTREVIQKFTVDLPKKHGRGGQSALRFARLRMEKRHNYVRKVAEHAVQHFITDDKVNVQGLVLAGSADFKTELSQSDMFDQRLQAKIIKVVDVSYGGENGFNQAIELAAESLSNVKFVQEKKLIQKYFDEISHDTGKYCFGVDDTIRGLEMGAVETLIVWENLDVTRHVLRDSQGAEHIVYAHAPPPAASNNKNEAAIGIAALSEIDRAKFIDKATGLEMEQAAEPMNLLEWFSEKYKDFGAELEFVTNRCVSLPALSLLSSSLSPSLLVSVPVAGALDHDLRISVLTSHVIVPSAQIPRRLAVRQGFRRHRRPLALQGRLCRDRRRD
jgi:peptide chain release factor subunit 1